VTFALTARSAPAALYVRSCRKRKSFACAAGERASISSRNSVPFSGAGREPLLIFARVRISAADMAEEFVFEEMVGERAAIHRDEREASPIG